MKETLLKERVDELESRLAFQDDTIQALNDVIAAQQLELGRLRRSLELLAQRQAEFADPVNNSV
ncbi:SlyX family protein [Halopseudomonas pachastrellae]|nr:SlyX family protein [Halopseudomonas pachastrellae]